MDIAGVLTCQIFVNGFLASCVVETGSAVSLIRNGFAIKHRVQFAKALRPKISVVTEECFSIAGICFVNVNILGYTATGHCGVVENFSYDILLGMDFLTGAPLLVDLKRKFLYNSEAPLFLEVVMRC